MGIRKMSLGDLMQTFEDLTQPCTIYRIASALYDANKAKQKGTELRKRVEKEPKKIEFTTRKTLWM